MTGTEATAYEVKRNMDRLPDFLDPETPLKFPSKLDGRIGRWLADRLTEDLAHKFCTTETHARNFKEG